MAVWDRQEISLEECWGACHSSKPVWGMRESPACNQTTNVVTIQTWLERPHGHSLEPRVNPPTSRRLAARVAVDDSLAGADDAEILEGTK